MADANSFLTQNIIQDLGLDKLSAEEQAKALMEVGKIIFQRVILRVMDELSEEDKNEFDKLLDEKMNDETAILNFLQSKLPNFNEIVNEEVAGFKKESSELMQAVKKSV